MKRLLIFVHYNPHDQLEDHVLYTLSQVRPLFDKIAFMSNSALSLQDSERLLAVCNSVNCRPNEGFDFAAWSEVMHDIGWDELVSYDSVTLLNDTCFGPIFPLDPIYERMESNGSDFWGNFAHPATSYGMRGTNGPIPEHLQSYFQVFSRAVVSSGAFQQFWDQVERAADLDTVIRRYEIQLTGRLVASGYCYSSIVPARADLTENAPVHFGEQLVAAGSPWVKVKAFDWYWGLPNRLLQAIESVSEYPTRLILAFFDRNPLRPPADVQLFDRFVSAPASVRSVESLRIAVYIHAYYPDVFRVYAEVLQDLKFGYDLFLTTDSEGKRARLLEIAGEHGLSSLKDVVITPNRGRDILPWLDMAECLNAYDIVGKFHTKRSVDSDAVVVERWQRDLVEALLVRPESVINEFLADPGVGVIIPDVPSYFHQSPLTLLTEELLRGDLNSLWERVGAKPYLFQHEEMPIFAYGNMFWYRPESLRPLTALHIGDDEVAGEPISPQSLRLLEAIERIPVYVARDQGYSFRIARVPATPNGFVGSIGTSRKLLLQRWEMSAVDEHVASEQTVRSRLAAWYRGANIPPNARQAVSTLRGTAQKAVRHARASLVQLGSGAARLNS